jgi:hypothetical protein
MAASILKQYTENEQVVTEYTYDGESKAFEIRQAVAVDIPEGTVIEIPKNPIQVLQAENENLKKQQAELNADLNAFMDYYFNGGIA